MYGLKPMTPEEEMNAPENIKRRNSMKKKTEFDLIFKDYDYKDWFITLHTSEPKTNDEIEDIIMTYADIVSNGILSEDYCPVDIMDRLCDAMQDEGRDWYWADAIIDEVVINGWK